MIENPVSAKTVQSLCRLKAQVFLLNFLQIGEILKILPVRNVNILALHCTALL